MTATFHADLKQRITERAASVTWDELPPELVAAALAEKEGRLAAGGALAVTTGVFTGRSVKDKFIVKDELTADKVWWDNSQAMEPEAFERLLGGHAEGGRRQAAPRPAPRRRRRSPAPAARSASSPRRTGTRCSSATC